MKLLQSGEIKIIFDVLKDFEIDYRREVTNVPRKLPSELVRDLDKRVVLSNSSRTFKTDYELLCNVVHPHLAVFNCFLELQDQMQLMVSTK